MERKSLYIPAILIGKIALVFLILYFNVGKYGFDAYIHQQYVDSIIQNNQIIEVNIAKSYYDFVGFHVFASAISLLTGLNTELIYEFVSVIIPILLFDLSVIAFIRQVEKKKRGYIPNDINLQYLSLILLYPAIIGIQMFLGRPNSLGIGLFSLCVYLYLCKPESFRSQIIAGFLAIVTVKVHHLSALFLLPVIFITSIFLAENYKSILSLIYAIPAVIIVRTILNSREFEIVNYYLSQNETYETLFNVFIKNEFSFLALWVIITLIGFIIRKRYGKKISEFFSKRRFTKYTLAFIVGAIVLVEIIGLFIYSANLPSWYITAELIIIVLLSGIALFFPDNIKYALFALGFCFYGLTVVFSLTFSSTEHELSWVAPRTFIFTLIFIGFLAYLSVSSLLKTLKKRWIPILISILLFNSYLSINYLGKQYLPGYNLTNDYQNVTFANSMESYVNMTTYNHSMSIPFSISKYIEGIDIYRIPLLLDANSTMEENRIRLISTHLRFIVVSVTMDQWLGTPLILSSSNLTYYLNALQFNYPTFHLVTSNGKNYLLYHI